MQLQELRMAKDRLFEEYIRYEARQVAAVIRNTPEEVPATQENQQPALSADPIADSPPPADPDDQKQIRERAIADAVEDTVSESDVTTGDVAQMEPSVEEAANSPTDLDAEDFREKEERAPSPEVGSANQFEISGSLKVSIFNFSFLF